tara:strand:- start:657 stop:1160 length:504 start_codon:yes stop_codon:yes gene_type:complete
MYKFLILLIFFSSLSFSNSFILNCENKDKKDTYKSLYFFNKVNRHTGYWVFKSDQKELVNVFHRKCKINDQNPERYTFQCKGGDYKFTKSTRDDHRIDVDRKTLFLSRLFIARMQYTGTSFWGDQFICKQEDLSIGKEKLKELREAVKQRNLNIKNHNKLKAEGNKI